MTADGLTILPPAAPDGGFWRAARRSGYDPGAAWVAASRALATAFALEPLQIRIFLDSEAGRMLADDLQFVDGGPTDAAAVLALIDARLGDEGWRRWYARVIAQVRAASPADSF